MSIKKKPIGFFDSGVGGLSVMREAMKIMPNEDYIYFGDSKNAPYGIKTVEEVRELTINAVEFLLDKDVKAIVIACNTATSAAIEFIRKKYPDNIIIGIEPAIKPAIKLNKDGKIIVMATPMTLREKKFKYLLEKYNKENNIISLPCAGLVEYIEQGVLKGDELKNYLTKKLDLNSNKNISAIVLGCTHYPFIKETISELTGEDVLIIDGGLGTSMELKRQLEERHILNEDKENGSVKIYNSNNSTKTIDFCYTLIS